MSEAKHTRGPWEIERVPIQSRGGSNTCFRIGPFHACIYDDWRPREAGISEQENESNAALIAAAPDLADALEVLLADVRSAFHEDLLPPSVEGARAALRKVGRVA